MALVSSDIPRNNCVYCDGIQFHNEQEFVFHLRERHCLIEGGSYVCRFGYNGVCCSLPVVGVSGVDYVEHVVKQHVTRPHSERDSPRLPSYTIDGAREDLLNGSSWNLYSGAQNLSSVLNDPNIGKEYNFFTSEWGGNFTETQRIKPPVHLPEISWGNFEEYVRKFDNLYQLHTKRNECRPTKKPSLSDDLLQNFPSLRSARLLKELVQMDLNSVPRIFFDPSFHLGKRNHFEIAFLSSRKMNSNTESEGENEQNYNVVIKGSHQSIQLLKVQLLHYLDVIEIQIAKQVEQQSDAFFQSTTSHDQLMQRLATSVKMVKMARVEVRKIEDTFIQHSLKVLRLRKLQMNYSQVLKKLKLMLIVTKTQCMVDSFLATSDYMAAFDMVKITKDILHRELVLIQCVRFQGSQLSEMERSINNNLIAEFERTVTEDLNETWINNVESNCHGDQFEQVVFGILMQKHFHCIDWLKSRVIQIVKDMVKTVEIEMIMACDSTVFGQFSLTEQLKCLPLPDWIIFFKRVTRNLLILIAHVNDTKIVIQEAVGKCIEKKKTTNGESINQSDQPHPDERFFSDDDTNKISSKLKDMMITICDFANHQVSKMMNAYWLVDKATASQFCDLGIVVEDFTAKCRDACGRSSSPLHSAFTAQANKFVQIFHQERKGKLGLILNSDCWKRVDVPTEFQDLVNRIIQSGNFSLVKLKTLESKPGTCIYVNDEEYMVVGSTLILLNMTTEYCVCAAELKDMASNVYRYLVELLQFFNARSCHLLLGANALFTAGLKSITSRNLALASRNLQLIVCILPFIRERFQITVKPSPKMGHYCYGIKMFDMVKRDIEQHVLEIEKKIKSIIKSLIAYQLNQWDASLPVPSKAFNNISKQLAKLHEAIGNILPPLQLQEIFRSAHDYFVLVLRAQLTEMNVARNRGSRSSIVTLEINCYVNAIEKLNVLPCHEVNRTFEDVWKPA